MRALVPARTTSVQLTSPTQRGVRDTSTHPTPLRNTDAKCPSALQVSGMTEDGKITPELAVTPLSANERMVATVSPVVAFNMRPLHR